MNYKVGDRVKIKSLEWYNKNKDVNGNVQKDNDYRFIEPMSKYCGMKGVIVAVNNSLHIYDITFDSINVNRHFWQDWMLEEPIEEPCEWCNTYLYYMEDGYTYPVENQKYCPVCGNKSNNY